MQTLNQLKVVTSFVLAISSASILQAHDVVWAPSVVVVKSVTAQGDILRAHGEAYRNIQLGNLFWAKAVTEFERAIDKRLDNWAKHQKTVFDRRLARESYLIQLDGMRDRKSENIIQGRRERETRVDDEMDASQLHNHAAILSANALNRLLNQIIMQNSASVRKPLPSLSLDHELFGKINVQLSGSEEKFTFAVNQTSAMNLDWWPHLLRREEFDKHRDAIRKTLQDVVAASKPGVQIQPKLIDQLDHAVRSIKQSYESRVGKHYKSLSSELQAEVNRGRNFLVRLDSDIARIRCVGHANSLGSCDAFELGRDGIDIQTLAAWMLRNGLVFARATPGNERYYYRLHQKLRLLRDSVSG